MIEVHDDAVNQFEVKILLLLHELEASKIDRHSITSVVFLCSKEHSSVALRTVQEE